MPRVFDSLAIRRLVAPARGESGLAFDVPRAAADALHAEVLELFDASAPGLRRYVRSCGLTPDAAEDVVQEAFLALFMHLRRGGARHNLRGWLVQVSHRLAIKQRMRLSRRQQYERLDDGTLPEIADPGEDVESRLIGRDRDRRFRAVYRALPARDRQCLSLRAAGVRYRDIAALLGISLGTVAASLARAAGRLSNAIQDGK